MADKTDLALAVSHRLVLEDRAVYRRMAHAASPYGDGRASERIARAILWHFGRIPERPADFDPSAG